MKDAKNPPLAVRWAALAAAVAALLALTQFQLPVRAWIAGRLSAFSVPAFEGVAYVAYLAAYLTATWLVFVTFYWDRGKSRLALILLLGGFFGTMALNVLGKLADWPKMEKAARFILYTLIASPFAAAFLVAAFQVLPGKGSADSEK